MFGPIKDSIIPFWMLKSNCMVPTPPYFVRPVHNLLYNIFEDGWIGKHEPFLWQAQALDLTARDFVIWG